MVEIGRVGFLESVDHDSLPWVNCEVMSNALPTDVFLRLGESYVFTVHLVINPLLAGVPFSLLRASLAFITILAASKNIRNIHKQLANCVFVENTFTQCRSNSLP